MSEFGAFLQLGFRHITDPRGLDHVLFLIALAAIYRFRDWRSILWVVTAFTVGHSVTLALAVAGALDIPAPVIEFLIPVTIVVTCIENLLVRDRERAPWAGHYRPVFAGVFGLVHGAGFANYLRSLFVDRIAVPLLAFNVGIEIGQIAVLLLVGLLFFVFDRIVSAIHLPERAPSPLRIRILAVSCVVGVIASAWAVERGPW